MTILYSFSQDLTVVLIIGISLALFGFWLWMLIDSIRFSKSYGKTPWAAIVGLFGIAGALIYFFTARKTRLKINENPYEGIVE